MRSFLSQFSLINALLYGILGNLLWEQIARQITKPARAFVEDKLAFSLTYYTCDLDMLAAFTWVTTISSLRSMSIYSSGPWFVPRVPCCTSAGITTCIPGLCLFHSSSTPGYYQWRLAPPHNKRTSTTSSRIISMIDSSFLANKYANCLSFGQRKSTDHFYASPSVLTIVTIFAVPSCCSDRFYSVETSVRHSPLLNTAGQYNLSVMILISVVTTKRCWTKSSTRTKVSKDGLKPFLVNKKRKYLLLKNWFLVVLVTEKNCYFNLPLIEMTIIVQNILVRYSILTICCCSVVVRGSPNHSRRDKGSFSKKTTFINNNITTPSWRRAHTYLSINIVTRRHDICNDIRVTYSFLSLQETIKTKHFSKFLSSNRMHC